MIDCAESQRKFLDFVSRFSSRRTPRAGHLTTLDIVLYSHEVETPRDTFEIEEHLKVCKLCRDAFAYYQSGAHFSIETLAHYALAEDYWNPISPELRQEIDEHIGAPKGYGYKCDFNCYRCHRIAENLQRLERTALYRLKNGDPMASAKYNHLFDCFARNQISITSALINMVQVVEKVDSVSERGNFNLDAFRV